MPLKVQSEILVSNQKALWFKSKLESFLKELKSQGKFKKIQSLRGERERYIKNIIKVLVKHLSVSSKQLANAQKYAQELFISNKADFMLEVVNYWDNQLIVMDLQKEFNQIVEGYYKDIDKLLLEEPCSYKNAEEALYYFKTSELSWKDQGKVDFATPESKLTFEVESKLQITAFNKHGQIITDIDENQNADIKQQKPNMLASSQRTISDYICKQNPAKDLTGKREEILDELNDQKFLPFMKDLEKVLRNKSDYN